jgi:hypothetical protein
MRCYLYFPNGNQFKGKWLVLPPLLQTEALCYSCKLTLNTNNPVHSRIHGVFFLRINPLKPSGNYIHQLL